MTVKARTSFQKIILQQNKIPKGETPSETMDKCFTAIKSKLTILDINYEFNKINNDDIYHIIPKSKATLSSTKHPIKSFHGLLLK